MVTFRDHYPPPWFYEEHHNRILVRDGYGMKLLTIDYSDMIHPGKRGSKFPTLSRAEARSLALAIVQMANA
jgi:hypothetical protein